MKNSFFHSRVFRIIDSWRRGVRPDTRAALEKHPEMRSESSAVMDLALEEYRLRCQSGEKLAVTQFCDAFSTYRDELRRMLDVENGISDLELMQQPEWPQPGKDFQDFHLLEMLGSGAASRVYLATQTNLGGRRVALKITPFETGEAHTLGKLQHRCVVPVLSVHEDKETGLTSVCMPYLGSATLQEVRTLAFGKQSKGAVPRSAAVILEAARRGVRDGEFLKSEPPPHRVLLEGSYIEGIAHVAAELAEGLAYTHEQQVLHRDLKPSNVLITPSGRPMLLDFNLAWDAQREGVRLGGTLPYMSPEQLYSTFLATDDRPPPDDPRSDIYSLGVVVYELLTGTLPFDQSGHSLDKWVTTLAYAKLRGAPPLRKVQPAVPRQLAEVIDACMRVELELRPQSARELAEALRRYGLRRRFRRPPPHTSKWLMAAAATGLVAVGTAAYSLASRHRDATTPITEAAPASVAEMTLSELLERGRQHLRGHDFLTASKFFRAADQREPNWSTKADLAYCHIQLQNFVLARSLLLDVVHERADDPDLLCNLGRCFYYENDFASAIKYLDRALVLAPTHVPSLHNRALCSLQSRFPIDPDGGIRFIEAAIQVSEAHQSTYPRLYLDAVHIVAEAIKKGCIKEDDAQAKLKHYLQLAVSSGVPKSLLEKQPFESYFKDKQWLRLQVASARSDITSLPSDTPVDLVVHVSN